jgi:glutaredoxin-related protein
METPQITAYLKTQCGWSNGVRAVLKKYDLAYTEKDIIQNPAFRWEMEQKSGQPLSPCVEVNGSMLADISGEELEQWMLQQGRRRARRHAAGRPGEVPGLIRFREQFATQRAALRKRGAVFCCPDAGSRSWRTC